VRVAVGVEMEDHEPSEATWKIYAAPPPPTNAVVPSAESATEDPPALSVAVGTELADHAPSEQL
jgi:hypothetical protein